MAHGGRDSPGLASRGGNDSVILEIDPIFSVVHGERETLAVATGDPDRVLLVLGERFGCLLAQPRYCSVTESSKPGSSVA